jgi:SAM-dependent methyltransferase
MTNEIFFEIHQGLPREGPGRNKYTKKAFLMLPKLASPRILDVGCGPGGPTLELARLSQGHVVGIDIHRPFLEGLVREIKEIGFSNCVQVVTCSMFEPGFADNSFDLVWAEGSIYLIGFENGLQTWRRLLKPGGFLVVHEMAWLRPGPPPEIHEYWREFYPGIVTVSENLEMIPASGYEPIGHFTLPEDAWWLEYYGPLEKRLQKLRRKYVDHPEALAVIDNEQQEIDMFRKYNQWYGSAFFVMQKPLIQADILCP